MPCCGLSNSWACGFLPMKDLTNHLCQAQIVGQEWLKSPTTACLFPNYVGALHYQLSKSSESNKMWSCGWRWRWGGWITLLWSRSVMTQIPESLSSSLDDLFLDEGTRNKVPAVVFQSYWVCCYIKPSNTCSQTHKLSCFHYNDTSNLSARIQEKETRMSPLNCCSVRTFQRLIQIKVRKRLHYCHYCLMTCLLSLGGHWFSF